MYLLCCGSIVLNPSSFDWYWQLVLQLANWLFLPLWNRDNIANVHFLDFFFLVAVLVFFFFFFDSHSHTLVFWFWNGHGFLKGVAGWGRLDSWGGNLRVSQHRLLGSEKTSHLVPTWWNGTWLQFQRPLYMEFP